MMMCASLRTSAAAIRASSCVNLSNRFRASSISFFPISFLRYFFARPRFISFVARANIFSTSIIICTIMSVIASVGRTAVWDSRRLKKFSMRLKRSTRASWLASTSIAAERRTPTPAKITCAGENTSPTPAPRVAEKAKRTLTVGLSHRDNLSSALLDLSSSLTLS
ncbi:hypothetical protein EI94DRAFT_1751706 [Lactarius quietus]|nr:hypothetical protein EI94DRAFT_1751706 [Lactarius quietus]